MSEQNPTPEDQAPPEGLTTEQAMAAGADARAVGVAGVKAAAEAPPERQEQAAAEAMRREADRKGVKISDEQINLIAQQSVAAMRDPEVARQFASAMADELGSRGAFDPPIDRVTPPPATPAQQAIDPQQPAASESPAPVPEAPRKRSLAERMLGG